MYRSVVFLLLTCVSFILLSGCPKSNMKRKEPVMKVYSSPNEVFDAYCQAYRTEDWRTVYSLFTSTAQRDMVFEAYFACGERDDPQLDAVREKLGASEAEFGKRYLEKYKQKHGHAEIIDRFLDKAIPYWESKDRGVAGVKTMEEPDTLQPPEETAFIDALPKDEELTREALYDATEDKVGFFAAVQEILGHRRKPNIIGDLKQVDIEGDTATGRVRLTIEPTPGSSPSVQEVDRTVVFRRVNSSWLLDSL